VCGGGVTKRKRPGETVVLTPVVTAAVSVTMVPLVTVAEESVRVVVVVAPKAKLSGADTVARRRPRMASKSPEKERLPDFR